MALFTERMSEMILLLHFDSFVMFMFVVLFLLDTVHTSFSR
jgi:hypothetical protein